MMIVIAYYQPVECKNVYNSLTYLLKIANNLSYEELRHSIHFLLATFSCL